MGTRVWPSATSAPQGVGSYSTASPFPVSLFPSLEAAINPRHVWRASNVQKTGALVDAIVDSGRVATPGGAGRNFTATGAERASSAVDSNGKPYLALLNSKHLAGAAADWRFLSNGAPWTLGVVTSRPVAVTLGSQQCLLGTSAWGSGSPGILLIQGAVNNITAGPGPVYGWTCGITGSGAPTCLVGGCTSIPQTGPTVLVIVHHGYRLRQNCSGMSAYDNQGGGENDPMGRTRCVAMELWENGRRIVEGFSAAQNYTASNPFGTLTLGRAADTAIPISTGLYELWIEDRALTQWDIEAYSRFAASQYVFAI